MSTTSRLVTWSLFAGAAATVAIAAGLRPWAPAPDLVSPSGPARGRPPGPVARVVTSVPAVPAPPPAPARAAARIDVVFAIDTTGSMGGLLDGARRSVWGIARHLRETNPGADLRVGLVAYRDVGDEYVTRPVPLSADLDGVYAALAGLEASGGGDAPEDVGAALAAAVHGMAWRADAARMLFVVGDAPPAARGDAPPFERTARDAAAAGITVNAIRCGQDPETAVAFARIAALGGGAFSTIAQTGGVQEVATPYDGRLAELAAELDRTAVIYGTDADRAAAEAHARAAAAAPAAVAADRAAYYAASGAGRAGDVLAAGSAADPASLDPGKLPPELARLPAAGLRAELARRVARRAALEAEVRDLTARRDAHLARDKATAGAAAFDGEVKGALDRALAR